MFTLQDEELFAVLMKDLNIAAEKMFQIEHLVALANALGEESTLDSMHSPFTHLVIDNKGRLISSNHELNATVSSVHELSLIHI